MSLQRAISDWMLANENISYLYTLHHHHHHPPSMRSPTQRWSVIMLQDPFNWHSLPLSHSANALHWVYSVNMCASCSMDGWIIVFALLDARCIRCGHNIPIFYPIRIFKCFRVYFVYFSNVWHTSISNIVINTATSTVDVHSWLCFIICMCISRSAYKFMWHRTNRSQYFIYISTEQCEY